MPRLAVVMSLWNYKVAGTLSVFLGIILQALVPPSFKGSEVVARLIGAVNGDGQKVPPFIAKRELAHTRARSADVLGQAPERLERFDVLGIFCA